MLGGVSGKGLNVKTAGAGAPETETEDEVNRAIAIARGAINGLNEVIEEAEITKRWINSKLDELEKLK